MEADVLASASVVVIAVAVGLAAYGLGVARARTFERVEADGGSAVLGKRTMTTLYWAATPIARAFVRNGVTANEVTAASVLLSLVAGVLLAFGRFGFGSTALLLAGLGDVLDGFVAREAGTASVSGEVLDSSADRYAEFFFLAGLAVHYRGDAVALGMTLLALLACQMVSYGSAKADALKVAIPRGSMRRAERVVILGAGCLLTPFTALAPQSLAATFVIPGGGQLWAREAPMLLAIAAVAIVGNVTAARRIAALARATHERSTVEKQPHNAMLARHQAASIVSALVDFGTMTVLVELGVARPTLATAIGAACGAITNFSIGRAWVFQATGATALPQAARYAIVSATSAVLNTAGEHFLFDIAGVNYLLARAIVAIFVSLGWNYPMQRGFVFRVHQKEGPR